MNALHIQLANGPVHCFDSQGSGITVLLLHGNSSAAEAFGAQFAALGRRHRLLALDLPGHGQSAAATPEHYSFAGYADALVQAIENLQLVNCL